MTLGELERYILSKQGAKKKAIPQWRYIRYTVYQSLFAAVEEVDGEVYCSFFGQFPDIRAVYPDCVLPAPQLSEAYSCVSPTGQLPDAVLRAMVDAAYEARCALMEQVKTSEDGMGDAPYEWSTHQFRPKNIYTDADSKKFKPHTVDTKYDAVIARYVRYWQEFNGQLTESEVAAASTLQPSAEEMRKNK